MAVGPGRRYASLDHWRGFAALWVMVFHTSNTWLEAKPNSLPFWLAEFCWYGWLGANVFFLLSGYCIAERIAQEYRTGGSMFDFITDRLRRIYPPYLAALAFTILLNVAASPFNTSSTFHPSGPWPGSPADWINALLVTEHWSGRSCYLIVAWTLSYEIGFYLLAALCLGLSQLTKQPWPGLALGGALFGMSLVPAVSTHLPLLELWPHFALGGLVWVLVRHIPSNGIRLAWGSLLLAIVAVAGSLLLKNEAQFTFRFVSACAWMLLILYPLDAQIVKWPGLRLLGWIGSFSYSLYLVHAPIVGKFRNALSRYWQPGDPGAIGVLLAACGLAIAASWLFYWIVERRTEQWRRIHRRIQATP